LIRFERYEMIRRSQGLGLINAVRQLLGLASVAVLTSCALFQTDAERGRHVADKWCSECHRIAPDQPSGMRAGHVLPPSIAAPSFMDVAAKPSVTVESLDHFLREVHLPMPTYRLRDDERAEVIAYILSLRPHQS